MLIFEIENIIFCVLIEEKKNPNTQFLHSEAVIKKISINKCGIILSHKFFFPMCPVVITNDWRLFLMPPNILTSISRLFLPEESLH